MGHASMMSENGWRYEWDTNGLAQTSVSSFPAGKSSKKKAVEAADTVVAKQQAAKEEKVAKGA